MKQQIKDFSYGHGAAQDFAQALVWLRKAADQGDAAAQFNLGWMYAYGDGVPQDYAQSLVWYRKAAEQGHAGAQHNLGVMYRDGHGVPQDYAQALVWLRKAADQGDAHAQDNLGWMYAQGLGVAQDCAQAVAWYRKAASYNQGFFGAQNNLGVMYRDEGQYGAQNNLGWMYVHGRGVPLDYAHALIWLRKAAEQGYADAQNNLGVMYRDGSHGVPEDYAQALVWCLKAADQGNADAQSQPRLDVRQRPQAWRRTTRRPSPGCARRPIRETPTHRSVSGRCTAEARAWRRTTSPVAVAWYRKAADQGFASAQGVLGEMYRDGLGVPQDYVRAQMLLNLAASRSDCHTTSWSENPEFCA